MKLAIAILALCMSGCVVRDRQLVAAADLCANHQGIAFVYGTSFLINVVEVKCKDGTYVERTLAATHTQ